MKLDSLLENGWNKSGQTLQKTFVLKDFMAAVTAVNEIAELAEDADHHPDIEIKNYKELTISLTTHSEGKVTQKDVDLAEKINSINLL